ncbi:hypothetical protein [Aestuariivirga sp.]|jgi:hypothetical protein|uniref:hypothetical protein n=1 Tax=Aestuariivirga sp. TaxID=2650926 RepID=UPI0037849647
MKVDGFGGRLQAGMALAAAWLAFSGGPSLGAEITVDPASPKEFPAILISGVFEDGDDKKFTALVLDMDNAMVLFESPGGDLLAGLNIGRAIRLKEFATAVDAGVECASACGLAWLGGIKRYAHPDARIGFHAAYIENNGQATETGAGNALVGAYLNQLSLPQSAIVYLTSAPPHDMQWLPLQEARNYGIDLEIVGGPEPGADGAAAGSAISSGEEIAAALAGNTVKGSMNESGAYEEFYGPDGAVKGENFSGTWRIDGDSMCIQYEDDPESCWQVKIDGGEVTWLNDGEEQGTGVIVEGNPEGF